MKQTIKKTIFLLLFGLIYNSAECKNKNITSPNLDKELNSQTNLIENKEFEITFYCIEDNLNSDDNLKVIIKETAELLKEIGSTKYRLTGNSNIEESERNAKKRSCRKATWLCHQFIIEGVNSELTVTGNGTDKPDFLQPENELQKQLNSNIKITIE